MRSQGFIQQSNQAYAADVAEIESHIASGNFQAMEARHKQSFGYHAAKLMIKNGRFKIPSSIKPILI